MLAAANRPKIGDVATASELLKPRDSRLTSVELAEIQNRLFS
jgi:hypothetical protein